MNHSLVVLALIASSLAVYGQTTVETTVGGDQIYDAYGLKTQYQWHQFSGWTGAGYSNGGARFGGYLKVPIKSMKASYFGVGDQKLEALLDTDEFSNHVLSARGISTNYQTKSSSLRVFSGLLLQEMMLPYMYTGVTSSGTSFDYTLLGAITYQRKLSPTLQSHSFTMVGKKLTSIESVGWHPSKPWLLAGAAGLGSGSKYLSGAGEYHKKRFDLRSSYTVAAKDFQRQEQPYYSEELVGLNAHLTVTPSDSIRLFADHQRSQSVLAGFPSLMSTVDSASIATRVLGLQLSPSVSRVRVDGTPGQTFTGMFSVTKQILPRWTAFGSYIYMDSPTFLSKDVVAINEFRISPRLTVRQDFDRIDGQSSYGFGGDWMSNRISFSVDQTMYVNPLAPAYGGKAVFQAWTFSIRLRTPHRTEVTLNTVVTPDGKMQWGGYLSGLRYSTVAIDHSDDEPSFSKYVIHGNVVDETGNKVWGIAVKVGSDTVFSDENGEFFLHVKNNKPMPLIVATADSLQSEWWKLQSAPESVIGVPEDASQSPVLIVVQMKHTSGQTVAQNEPNID